MCIMAVSGPAPCQCFSPGGIQTVSPGRISRIGPPQACTRPTPETTCKVCPSGWVCQAVRALGSNLTQAPLIRPGAGASAIGSCQTVPVKFSAGVLRDGTEPNGLMSMTLAFLLMGCEGPSTDRRRPEGRQQVRDVRSLRRGRAVLHHRRHEHPPPRLGRARARARLEDCGEPAG